MNAEAVVVVEVLRQNAAEKPFTLYLNPIPILNNLTRQSAAIFSPQQGQVSPGTGQTVNWRLQLPLFLARIHTVWARYNRNMSVSLEGCLLPASLAARASPRLERTSGVPHVTGN